MSVGTLFVVFSRGLKEYVSHVLPALGVDKARVTDFPTWAHKARRQHFPALPRALREDTPSLVARAKTHPAVLEVLAAYAQRMRNKPAKKQRHTLH